MLERQHEQEKCREEEDFQEKMCKLAEKETEKHATEVVIEHNCYEETDTMTEGQCAAHEPDEERPEPETSEWHGGTTQDMDCQKAFHNTVHNPASVIASGNESAVRGNSFVGKLDFPSSRLGYVVLLGGLWRFPYLCHGIDSGVFLLSLCIVMHICVSIPLILTEVLFKQFASAIT